MGLAGPGIPPSLGPGLLVDGAGRPPPPAAYHVVPEFEEGCLQQPGSRVAVKSAVPHYCFLTCGLGFLPKSRTPERRLPLWKKAVHTCILDSWGRECFL